MAHAIIKTMGGECMRALMYLGIGVPPLQYNFLKQQYILIEAH